MAPGGKAIGEVQCRKGTAEPGISRKEDCRIVAEDASFGYLSLKLISREI